MNKIEKIEKRPYELSIWEDRSEQSQDGRYISKEIKIAIIGSNTMTSKGRAIATKLNRKINGEIELSFEMMRRYWDSDFDKEVENPFLKYLVNERKIKLKRWDIFNNRETNVKWYDLIIKQINETSDKNKIEIVAKSIWVNELGRQGFALTLSKEAMNNQGTLGELTEKVLENSNWRYDENSYHPPQYQKNPVCRGKLTGTLQATNPFKSDSDSSYYLDENSVFYIDYTKKDNLQTGAQIIVPFDSSNPFDDNFIIKGDTLIITSINGKIGYEEVELGTKGKFLVQTHKSHYDKVLEKYVYEYTVKDSEPKEVIYGFEETDYTNGSITEELCTNGGATDMIVNTGGWFICNETGEKLREAEIRYLQNNNDIKGSITGNNKEQKEWLGNTGLSDKKDILENINEYEQFVVAIKNEDYTSGVPIEIRGVAYNRLPPQDSKVLFEGKFEGSETKSVNVNDTDWYYIICTVNKGIKLSYSELLKLDLLVLLKEETSPENNNLAFTNFSYFRYIEKKDGNNTRPLFPGEFINAQNYTVYNYFEPEFDKNLERKEDYCVEKMSIPRNDLIPIYTNNYEMVRDVEAKESNRFNIIQTLAETFEVWPEFRIEHDENGAVALDEEGRPQKYVKFNQYSGKDNYAGFRYGLNLKSIKRKIDSEKITSKIIVKPNANEFAPNKSCKISDASENFLGEDFLYNFEYYLNQNLIDKSKLKEDLYKTTGDSKDYENQGIYVSLPILNKEKNSLIGQIAELNMFLTKTEAQVKELEYNLNSLQETKVECATKFETAVGQTIDDFRKNYPDENWFDSELQASRDGLSDAALEELRSYLVYDKKLSLVQDNYKSIQKEFESKKKEVENINLKLEGIVNLTSKIKNDFEDKYSPFIQEGSWISEDYRDPNLYYLDAANVLATSSVPQLTYTIETLAIDQLPEWKAYKFELGDITYMEDVQFFGTKRDLNGEIVPKKEEIVVTQITEELDEPSKDKIETKNYKNRFEDLFQRITATTESLQFKEGEYNRSAAAITAQGRISNAILNESLKDNSATIQNSKEQTVKWQEKGIIIKNNQNPNEISKIVGNGFLVSNDGGVHWTTGLSPQGINGELIQGILDTGKVIIKSKQMPGFYWDNSGLNSYEAEKSLDGTLTNFNLGSFLRQDHFGIYRYSKGQEQEYKVLGEQGFIKVDEFFITEVVNSKRVTNNWEKIKVQKSDESYITGVTRDQDASSKIVTPSSFSLLFSLIGQHDLFVQKTDNPNYDLIAFSFEIEKKYLNTEKWLIDNAINTNNFSARLCYGDKDNGGNAIWRDIQYFREEGYNVIETSNNISYQDNDEKILFYFSKKVPKNRDSVNWIDNNSGIVLVNTNGQLQIPEKIFFVLQINNIAVKDTNSDTEEIFAFKLFGISSVLLKDPGYFKIHCDALNGRLVSSNKILIGTVDTNSNTATNISLTNLQDVITNSNFSITKLGININDLNGNSIFQANPLNGEVSIYGRLLATELQSVNGIFYWDSPSGTVSDLTKKNSVDFIKDKYDDFFNDIIPRVYKYNSGTSGRIHLGFIAQEIEEALMKNKLTTNDFGGFIIKNKFDSNGNLIQDYYLRYEEFISLNTWQIQKLKSRTTELENEILILKQEIENLKSSQNSVII